MQRPPVLQKERFTSRLRLTDLVGQLLEATHAEGDPSAVVKEELRLDEIVGELVEDCQLDAAARGCKILFRSQPHLSMPGSPELLRRAIENILRNAIRYSPENSTVELAMNAMRDTARISVRDYGPGVPEDMLTRIFQPFFRVDDSRSSETGGVGLGLTIAQRAVVLHQGRIWAENANPGLRVILEMPIEADGQIAGHLGELRRG
jgi:two-component system sensor histidine kinase CpxA